MLIKGFDFVKLSIDYALGLSKDLRLRVPCVNFKYKLNGACLKTCFFSIYVLESIESVQIST